jgi:hypothetical protein
MDVAFCGAPIGILLPLLDTSGGLTNQQIVLILGIVGVSSLLLVMTRRRMREARNSPKTYAREQLARLRDEQAVMRDMEELMVQLEEVSRRIQAQLDTKFVKLETVIRDADTRIERLERLVRESDGRPTLDVTVGDKAEDEGKPGPSPTLRWAKDGARADEPPLNATGDGADNDLTRRRIFELADAGKSPVDIAQETGQTTGEVELILALRKAASPGYARSAEC